MEPNFLNYFQEGTLPDFGLLDSPGNAGNHCVDRGAGPSSKSRPLADQDESSGDEGDDGDGRTGAGKVRKKCFE